LLSAQNKKIAEALLKCKSNRSSLGKFQKILKILFAPLFLIELKVFSPKYIPEKIARGRKNVFHKQQKAL